MDTTGTVVNLRVDKEKGWSLASVVEPEEIIGGKAKGMILERDGGVTQFKLSGKITNFLKFHEIKFNLISSC